MKKGFTLIEVLMALGLSSLVFVLVSSLLVTLLTSNSKNRRQEVFEQVKNDLFVELSGAVKWGEEVEVGGTEGARELTVDGVVYRVEGERLTRGGEPLTPGGVVVKSWEINEYGARPDYAGLEITVEMEDRSFSLAKDQLRVVAAQRKTEVEGL